MPYAVRQIKAGLNACMFRTTPFPLVGWSLAPLCCAYAFLLAPSLHVADTYLRVGGGLIIHTELVYEIYHISVLYLYKIFELKRGLGL